MPLRIGFIGLGAMGAPMAAHIHRRQPRHPLIVHARRRESAGDLLAQRAQWAPTPAEVAAQAEVVIAMLPDLPELRSVLDGGQGLLAGVTRPTTVVVCSTSSPAATRDLGAELRRRTGGLVALVDAPVSGGVEGARAGDLSIFVGGEPAAAASAARALRPRGRCSHLGPLGAGQVAQAANQH